MIYFFTMQILSFFIVGSFYISIKLFFSNYFKHITNTPSFNWKHPGLWEFFNSDDTFGFKSLFSFGYITILVLTILVSLATQIDKAISYFRIIAMVFSVMTIFSLIGITAFLIGTGFYPEERQYNVDTKLWEPLGIYNFSWLTLSGVIMLGVYLLPIVFRPIDFVFNLPQYCLGIASYMLMLPIFVNVMQVYSMCNLHDLSWGNRPSASSGAEALSSTAKKQQDLKTSYMVFRVNFLTFWIGCNITYAMIIENYVTNSDSSKSLIANSGEWGFLEIFSLYLACLVLYRAFFGGLHLLKFKILRKFYPEYKTYIVDLHNDVK